MARDVVVIRNYPTEMEALVAQAVLDAEGIDSIILRDNAGGMLPVLQVLFEVRLAVRRADAARALARLADEDEGGGRGDGSE